MLTPCFTYSQFDDIIGIYELPKIEWPQQIWIKVRISWQITPQHQSKYFQTHMKILNIFRIALIFFFFFCFTMHKNWTKAVPWIFFLFLKATKFCEIFTLLLSYVSSTYQSKISWRFRKILWPSQNIWTLLKYVMVDNTGWWTRTNAFLYAPK